MKAFIVYFHPFIIDFICRMERPVNMPLLRPRKRSLGGCFESATWAFHQMCFIHYCSVNARRMSKLSGTNTLSGTTRLLLTVSLTCGWMSICAQPTAPAPLKDYPIQPVEFTHVHVNDNFWAPRIKANAEITIPYTLEQCRVKGRVDNFRRAAGKMPADTFTAYTFDDTDIYKVIEGASYVMQVRQDRAQERYIDTLISIIADAQEPDGYLYTFRTMKAAKPHEWVGAKRWELEENLSHELYNSGHLFEAAVAHYQATGKKTLLNIAIRNADLLVRDFGWGKTERFPGHQIIETGLTKLYRATGNIKYLELAKFFLDVRGPGKKFSQEYNQAHKKVVDQHEAVGHAVRATYMYAGMADVSALTGDKKYLDAIDAIWEDVVSYKLYLTGGIGATGAGEAFGKPYQLPNMSAYAETCASIANVYWNNRMFLLHGDSKYIDVLEKVLYNGLLSGISLSGNRFFYPNPLASVGQHQRSAWFDCACCISNMTRFLPSVPGYVYAQNNNDLYVNLYMGNSANIKLPAGTVGLIQRTEYPWQGNVALTVNPEKEASFTLRLRIPGWVRNDAIPGELYEFATKTAASVTIRLNGKPIRFPVDRGYAVVNRKWKKGDLIEVLFPLEIKRVLANVNVKEDQGRFAFQRGPLVYCIEGPDNADSSVHNIVVEKNAPVTVKHEPSLLNGITVIHTQGNATSRQVNSDILLKQQQAVKAIPYYAWANRGPGEMAVWIPFEDAAARPKPAPTIASLSVVSSSLSNKRMYKSLNDQYDPADSKDHAAPYLHWWPKKNSTEWVQYDFVNKEKVSESQIYWFDDGPWGGCRIPISAKLLYLRDGQWIPVKIISADDLVKDKYNKFVFEPVETNALRLEIRQPVENSSGIHEWKVK
jgi:uncharacterized protein